MKNNAPFLLLLLNPTNSITGVAGCEGEGSDLSDETDEQVDMSIGINQSLAPSLK